MVYHRNGHQPALGYDGLGAQEMQKVRNLPPRLAAIVAENLDDPETVKLVSKLLREPNPAQAIAGAVSQAISESVFEDPDDPDYYFEEVLETNSKGVQSVQGMRERGLGSLGAFKSIKRIAKKVGKPFMKTSRRYLAFKKRLYRKSKPFLPIVIGVAGAVLAPFTLGLSAVAATAVIEGRKYHLAKKAAKKAKEEGKREAAAMEAEAAAMEKEFHAKADSIYDQAPDHFLAAGYPRERWDALSVEEKIEIIERMANGTMPASSEAAEQAAQEQGVTPEPPPTHTQAGYPPRPEPEERPVLPPTEEEEEAPAGTYELYVEKRKVGEARDLQGIAVLIGEKSNPGDRFEVFFNGKPTGLKIRTPKGAVSVPPEDVAKVLAMSHAEVQDMVIRAAGSAHEKTKAGIPWWLVVGGAGAAVVAAGAS